MLNSSSKLLGALAVAVTGIGLPLSALAGDTGDSSRETRILKERAGAVIDVASKRAVTYYVKSADACDVSVLLSETYPEQIPFNIASVRFSARVPAGTSTEVATSDGSSLSLSCSRNAKSLAVNTNESVAWAAATN